MRRKSKSTVRKTKRKSKRTKRTKQTKSKKINKKKSGGNLRTLLKGDEGKWLFFIPVDIKTKYFSEKYISSEYCKIYLKRILIQIIRIYISFLTDKNNIIILNNLLKKYLYYQIFNQFLSKLDEFEFYIEIKRQYDIIEPQIKKFREDNPNIYPDDDAFLIELIYNILEVIAYINTINFFSIKIGEVLDIFFKINNDKKIYLFKCTVIILFYICNLTIRIDSEIQTEEELSEAVFDQNDFSIGRLWTSGLSKNDTELYVSILTVCILYFKEYSGNINYYENYKSKKLFDEILIGKKNIRFNTFDGIHVPNKNQYLFYFNLREFQVEIGTGCYLLNDWTKCILKDLPNEKYSFNIYMMKEFKIFNTHIFSEEIPKVNLEEEKKELELLRENADKEAEKEYEVMHEPRKKALEKSEKIKHRILEEMKAADDKIRKIEIDKAIGEYIEPKKIGITPNNNNSIINWTQAEKDELIREANEYNARPNTAGDILRKETERKYIEDNPEVWSRKK